VGVQLKEQKVLDRRPKKATSEPAPSPSLSPSMPSGLSPAGLINPLSANPSNNVEVKS
jgi:hypothetical protein